MVAGSAGWLTGRILKAAVSRQREHLADARAVQWTRSRDGLGQVLRKVMTQRAQEERGRRAGLPEYGGVAHPVVQHMLLVQAPDERRWMRRLDSHPPLKERVRAIYGRPMPPLPVAPLQAGPEPAFRGASAAAGAVPLAAQFDPFASR